MQFKGTGVQHVVPKTFLKSGNERFEQIQLNYRLPTLQILQKFKNRFDVKICDLIFFIVSVVCISLLFLKVRERFVQKTANYNRLRKKDKFATSGEDVSMVLTFVIAEKEDFDSPETLRKQRKRDKNANKTENLDSVECGMDYDSLRHNDQSQTDNSPKGTTTKVENDSSNGTMSEMKDAFGDPINDSNCSTGGSLCQGDSSQTTNSLKDITSIKNNSPKGTTSEVNDTFKEMKNDCSTEGTKNKATSASGNLHLAGETSRDKGDAVTVESNSSKSTTSEPNGTSGSANDSNSSLGEKKNKSNSTSGKLNPAIDTCRDNRNGASSSAIQDNNGVIEISYGKYPDVANLDINRKKVWEKLKMQQRNTPSEDLNLEPFSDNGNERDSSAEDNKNDEESVFEDSKLIEIKTASDHSDEENSSEDSKLIDS